MLILLWQIRIFLRFASPQIANPQISTKYCTTLFQSSPRLYKHFYMYKFELEHAIHCKEKSTCGLAEVFMSANHKKTGSANRKSVKCHISRKVRKSNQLCKSGNLPIYDLRDLCERKGQDMWLLFSVATSDKFVVFTQIEKQRSPSRPSPVADQTLTHKVKKSFRERSVVSFS